MSRWASSRWSFVVWVLGFGVPCAGAFAGEFQKTRIPGEEPLSTIEVSFTTSAAGEALDEPLDLHLGLGFPLRLYTPQDAESRPGFAAYPQATSPSSLTEGLMPGETATFTFQIDSADARGADELNATPALLRDLRVRDVQRLGFASPARSGWMLEDYSVKLNGKLFANHRGIRADAREERRVLEGELQQLSAEYEYQAREAAELVEVAASGLARAEETARLQELQATLQQGSERLTELALRINGALPWYVESHEDFRPAPIAGDPVRSIEVGLTTQVGPNTGSENPLYLWIDGRKFQLTSEVDPLSDDRQLQTFQISAAELAANPVVRRRVGAIGVGMLGHNGRQGREPDRARLRRVTVVADGKPIYDSRQVPDDLATLQQTRFIPPAHYDDGGRVVANAEENGQTSLWKSTTLLPPNSPPLEEIAEDVPLEPAVYGDVPTSDNPPLIIYLGDDGEEQPSTPRRRKRRADASAAPTAASIPTSAPAAAQRSRPVTSQPGPKAPVLTNIRINPAIPILRDGDRATVLWQVTGDTSNVARYRVDLFGVLPHKNPALIGTALATQRGISPSPAPAGRAQSMQARPPAINVAAIRGQLSGAEESYLYIQPKVSAIASDGTILTSGFGSILPLFPAEVSSPPTSIMLPGAVFVQGTLSPTRPPSFQVLPAAGPAGSWLSSTTADPGGTSVSWTLPGETDAGPALTFASYVATPPAAATPAYNVAVRPTARNGERVAVQYEGIFPVPSTLPTPRRGWRVVGHVCFIGGNRPGGALVQTRADVSVRPASPAPFFTMQTPSPMTFNKLAGGTKPGPAFLIDMPLRFDLMAANNLAASNHDKSKYAVAPLVNVGANGFQAIGSTPGGQVGYVT
ncbi:MAG: hypothetical protein J0M17_04420, partial [Planctomycetes bacterium]|nr:hypothetical protein [Planctomycetota bacterium]